MNQIPEYPPRSSNESRTLQTAPINHGAGITEQTIFSIANPLEYNPHVPHQSTAYDYYSASHVLLGLETASPNPTPWTGIEAVVHDLDLTQEGFGSSQYPAPARPHEPTLGT